MKKRFITLITAILFLAIAFPAMAALQDMQATVHRWTGNYNTDGSPGLSRAITGITYKVLAVDSNTAETLYAFGSKALTAKTNPVTTTVFAVDDEIRFRVDPTDVTNDRYVDLIVTDTVGGYSTIVKSFDKYTHTIVIDERPNIIHHGLIWYVFNDNAATSTGITFTPKTAILDVWVEQITVDNTETLNVGTSDTAAGFRSAVALSTGAEGFTADTGFITGGTNIDYTPATNYGSLLTTAITGSDAVATNGGNSRKVHFVNTAGTDDDLYYTESAGGDTAAGYIHYTFIRLR